MSLRLNTRQVDAVKVIDLSGKITLGTESAQLRQTIRDLVSEGNNKILLNLGDVSYVDSVGLGQLVSSLTTVSREGGQLKLLSLTRRVHDLLQITKLTTVFEIFNDEGKALQSFNR